MSEFIKFKYSLVIKEHHLDSFNHVNNATYMEILEEARWEFLHHGGVGLKTIHHLGIGPIILECHIKFLKELRLRQQVIVESQMLSFEKKIGIMRQEIFDEEANLCCYADMTFGLFDLNARKLMLPTPEWLKAIGLNEMSRQ